MKIKQVVLWGASGHSKVVANALKHQEHIKIVGHIDDHNIERHGQLFEGRKILGGVEQLQILKEQGVSTIVLAFGHCSRRIEVGEMLTKQCFEVLNVTHPQSIIAADVPIGVGSVILAGAIIDPGCSIDDYAIINNGAIINHDSTIGKGTHICPGVTIAGGTTVGESCWIGIGSALINNITIGDSVFIGAGSVVTKNIPSGFLAYGNPAKMIKKLDHRF